MLHLNRLGTWVIFFFFSLFFQCNTWVITHRINRDKKICNKDVEQSSNISKRSQKFDYQLDILYLTKTHFANRIISNRIMLEILHYVKIIIKCCLFRCYLSTTFFFDKLVTFFLSNVVELILIKLHVILHRHREIQYIIY